MAPDRGFLGVGSDHLDHYLNDLTYESVFRFDGRYHPVAGFATLLRLGTTLGPTTATRSVVRSLRALSRFGVSPISER